MADVEWINEESLDEIKKAYSHINALNEEKKSISEDIREEKLKLSKKTQLKVKDLNEIFKLMQKIDTEDYNEENVQIAKAVMKKVRGIS